MKLDDVHALLELHREGDETLLQALERIVEQWVGFTEPPGWNWHRIQAALLPHFVESNKAGGDRTIADTCERLLKEHQEQRALLEMRPAKGQLSLFEGVT